MTTKPSEQSTMTHPSNAPSATTSSKPTRNGDSVREATKKLDRALEGLTTEQKARAIAAVAMLHGFLDAAQSFIDIARANGAAV